MLNRLPEHDKKQVSGILLLFFLIFFILHYFMPVVSDDLRFHNGPYFQSFFLFYVGGAGKILTDSLGGYLNRIPFLLWKLLDSALWCGMICLFVSVIFSPEEKNRTKWTFYLIAGFILLCYPYRYLSSAGYIFTSTNYIYPAFCILACVNFLVHSPIDRKGRFSSLLASLVCAAYAGSQEQSACVLFGLLLGIVLLKLYRKESFSKAILIAEFAACAAVFIIVMTSPEHIARSAETTGRFCVPNFDNWSFSTKLLKGYTTTAAVTLFCPCYLYYIFVFLLLLCGLRKKSPIQKLLSALPGLESLIIYTIGSEWFVEYPDYGYGMPDIKSYYLENETFLFLVLSLCIVISVILAIFASQDSLEKSVILLFLAAVAFSSRIIMGFSATLFGSSFRTFSFLLFLLIAADLFLVRELYDDKKFYPVFFTFIAVLAVVSYASGLQSITLG